MLSILGKLALRLNMGESRKDALTNAGAIVGIMAATLEALIASNLLPPKYQSIALTVLSVSVAVLGLSSGRDSTLRGVQEDRS